MLPGIRRWTDDKVLDEAADRLARMALGACDGQTHGNPFYSAAIGYPTRRNTEALVRLALTPTGEATPFARGFSLDELFAAAWDRVAADEGEDPEALELLQEVYSAILAEGAWEPTPALIDRAVAALASFQPDSLWVEYVQAAYPNHPQTPGSEKFEANLASGNPVETVENPFLRKP